ncbi:MAG: class II aldolase/adducin family protein [Myxococcales bacterium]|jgi:ribulose-5-phosphate 4-epimerase/fuculose-1-phosphate aldolase
MDATTVMALKESRLTSLPEAEAKVRVELAAAYRLVALFGWDDLIFTHLSVRVPDSSHFLINPYGLLFEEITASSLVKIDVEGNKVEDSPFVVNPAGFVIHSALHTAREDAHAVIHLHTADGQAVSAQKQGLLPITQTAMLVSEDLAYHDYEGLAVDVAERERLVADMGERHALMLRNHGTLTVGETVSDAFIRMYFLERACTAQVRAQAGGAELHPAAPGSIARTAQAGEAGLTVIGRALAWPALLRKLDRNDAGYRR